MKPRPSTSYSVASSAARASTASAEISSSSASRCGGTGPSATITRASRARRVVLSLIGRSPLVLLDGHAHEVGVAPGPGDAQLAQALGLLQVDGSLLVELEYGQEADDHGQALHQ